ncbi:condensin complex subunit 1-like, partial [Heptranchias perlo]|uniref:condensin complex subunit 1-like n=1 Tax=Heptranchias perlo TaxID=212740 RepID=UPI00355AC346
MLLEPGEEWEAMQPELLLTIQAVLKDEESEGRETIGRGDSAESVCTQIRALLKGARYKPAVRLALDAMERFKGAAPFTAEDPDDPEREGSRNESGLLKIMAACFRDTEEADADPGAEEGAQVGVMGEEQPEAPGPPEVDEAPGPPEVDEAPGPSEMDKQEVLVQFLREALTFTVKIQGAIEIISKFLSSKNSSVVQEAIEFFVAISEFGISQALVGVRQMLPLVWSKEPGVKEAVIDAYRRLYLNSNGQ